MAVVELVTSVAAVPLHVRVARGNLEMARLSDRVEIIEGDAVEILPAILEDIRHGRRDKFDFVFIDADKLNSWVYFDHAADMAHPGACIIVDNVVSRDVIVDPKLVNTVGIMLCS